MAILVRVRHEPVAGQDASRAQPVPGFRRQRREHERRVARENPFACVRHFAAGESERRAVEIVLDHVARHHDVARHEVRRQRSGHAGDDDRVRAVRVDDALGDHRRLHLADTASDDERQVREAFQIKPLEAENVVPTPALPSASTASISSRIGVRMAKRRREADGMGRETGPIGPEASRASGTGGKRRLSIRFSEAPHQVYSTPA